MPTSMTDNTQTATLRYSTTDSSQSSTVSLPSLFYHHPSIDLRFPKLGKVTLEVELNLRVGRVEFGCRRTHSGLENSSKNSRIPQNRAQIQIDITNTTSLVIQLQIQSTHWRLRESPKASQALDRLHEINVISIA